MAMKIEDMPISNVQWIDVNQLVANDYNPNVVFTKEMELLKLSLLKQGWIQPILVTHEYVIIDGFHRSTIAKTDMDVFKLTRGKVPCVVMDLTEPERMLLTIRINRAKGSHIALNMCELVKRLVNDFCVPVQQICEEIGATRDEVDLLVMENVFEKFGITKSSEYSKAWVPRT